jgi:hypothetical protein
MSLFETLKSLLPVGLFLPFTDPPTSPCFEQENAAEEAANAVDRAVALLQDRVFALIDCQNRNKLPQQPQAVFNGTNLDVVRSFTVVKSELAILRLKIQSASQAGTKIE